MAGGIFSGSQGVPDQTPVNKPENQTASPLGVLGRVPMLAWVALGLGLLWWLTRKN